MARLTAVELFAQKLADLALTPGTHDAPRYARTIRAIARQLVEATEDSPEDATWWVAGHAILSLIARTEKLSVNRKLLERVLLNVSEVEPTEFTAEYRAKFLAEDRCRCQTDPGQMCFAETHEV